MKYQTLTGSERALPTGTRVIGKANPNRVIQVTLQVKSSKDPSNANLAAFAANLIDSPLSKRSHLSRETFASAYGLAPADIQKVGQFAKQFGLRTPRDAVAARIGSTSAASRTVELRGTIAAFSEAFGVELVRTKDAKGRIRRAVIGSIQVPEAFQDVIENVFGLDTRPQANPKFKIFPNTGGFAPHLGATSYAPGAVAKLYNFPQGVTGKGQTIGIIELGGGFRRRDLTAYFHQLGIPMPRVFTIPVSGGCNQPIGDPNSADAEVMLDIEVAGSVAHDARMVVYFGPNTSRGFFRAVSAAVNDNVNKPTIISISWGGPEAGWSKADMNSMTELFQAAAALGVSVFVAAGDNGSTDGVAGNVAHVDFPASSPFATACGGTTMLSSGATTISSEVVWNDGGAGTGGGISDVFGVPVYQTGPGISLPPSVNAGHQPGRGVPDVAGNADPATGYKVRVDGVDAVIGGTSAVAPLWAGLFALVNESVGTPVGFANTLLYGPVSAAGTGFHDITQGNNDISGRVGGYSSGPGWDPCTGLGTPNGSAILAAIKSS
jgi:kumamolisin